MATDLAAALAARRAQFEADLAARKARLAEHRQAQAAVAERDPGWPLEVVRAETLRLQSQVGFEALRAVDRDISILGWILPDQAAQTRRALIEGRRVPVWTYRRRPLEVARDTIGRAEAAVSVNIHPAADAAREQVARFGATVAVFQRVTAAPEMGNEEISDWSRWFYGVPDAATTAWADQWMRVEGSVPDRPSAVALPAEEAVAVLRGLLAQYAPQWTARAGAIAARMMVDSPRRSVVVAADALFSAPELLRLVVHEVGAHALRTINAEASGEAGWAALPLGVDAALTEEGLAVWWEHHLGVSTPAVTRRYAARVLAVNAAASGSIVDVYESLVPTLGAEEAAALAVRVKRGMTDPMAPGAFTKDHVYGTGFVQMRSLLSGAGGVARATELMRTKWGASLSATASVVKDSGLLLAAPPLVAAPDRNFVAFAQDHIDAAFRRAEAAGRFRR